MANPKLDEIQRTILANQYRILSKLDPTGGWDKALEVVENGYELEYQFEDRNVLDEDQCREVLDILTMYRALKDSYARLGNEEQAGIDASRLKFLGFDGNDPTESQYMAYVNYLWKTERFTESKDDGQDGANSHMPVLDLYRRMMAAYDVSGNRHRLSRADIVRIVGAFPYRKPPAPDPGTVS